MKQHCGETIFYLTSGFTKEELFENQVGTYAESALYRNLWNNTMEDHLSSAGFTNLEVMENLCNYERSAIYLTLWNNNEVKPFTYCHWISEI